MYEKIRDLGDYRVDYLNQEAVGCKEAFGFYVLGDAAEHASCSIKARRDLLTGLSAICTSLAGRNLVGVYVDVNHIANLDRPAYRQMKRDIQAGWFVRVLVVQTADLLGHPAAQADFEWLSEAVGGIEVTSLQGGASGALSLQRLTFSSSFLV